MRLPTALLLSLGLAGCGSASSESAGGLSASEASALNDAAAELDAQAGTARSGDAGLNPAAIKGTRRDRDRRAPSVQ